MVKQPTTGWHLKYGFGSARMRHLAQSELEETKERLRELERLKLIGPEDLEILSTKRALKRRLSELEERQAADRQGKGGRGKP